MDREPLQINELGKEGERFQSDMCQIVIYNNN